MAYITIHTVFFRYPDDWRQHTKEFAEEHLDEANEFVRRMRHIGTEASVTTDRVHRPDDMGQVVKFPVSAIHRECPAQYEQLIAPKPVQQKIRRRRSSAGAVSLPRKRRTKTTSRRKAK